MIYSFFGTDREKIVARGKDIVASAHKKRPDAEVLRYDASTFTTDLIPDLTARQGLFERKMIVVLDDVYTSKTYEESFKKTLGDFKESDNLFIFLSGKLLKEEKTALTKYSEKHEELSLPPKPEEKENNGFAITDALLARNRDKAWSLLAGVRENIHAEMLAGTLTWQIRAMLLASEPGMTEAKSKLSPYVFKKSAAGAKKYTREELKDLLLNVTLAYHRGHNGEDLMVELEKVVLSV